MQLKNKSENKTVHQTIDQLFFLIHNDICTTVVDQSSSISLPSVYL